MTMRVGSAMFESYNRTLRRLMWADFVDEQMRVAREQSYRASLVEQPYDGHKGVVAALAVARSSVQDCTR
jgi:hypothetical protein